MIQYVIIFSQEGVSFETAKHKISAFDIDYASGFCQMKVIYVLHFDYLCSM
jgi:hypothetical protein